MMSPARRCAYDALNEWEAGSRFADEILGDLSKKMDLISSDHGLACEIFYGTLRNLYLLDVLIDKLRKGKIKPFTQNLLRIGLYQLFKTEIAEHAAVNETVQIARKHEKSLVNAILRNAQRSKAEFEADMANWSLEDRYSHPQFFIDRWTEQHGGEAAIALCEWNNTPPVVFARIQDPERFNTVEPSIEEGSRVEGFPDFFTVKGATDSEWLSEGLIYIQDPSTSLACNLLDPQPGEDILDACAAPGGKTALISKMMKGEGKILASDQSEYRLEQLRGNLERLRVKNADLQQIDWLNPPEDLPKFDAILLDAPCSNTGVMRRRVDVRWRIQPYDFGRQTKVQAELLESVSKFLKPEGRIIYSTCSIDREENEGIVEASGLKVEKIVKCLPWKDGYDGAFAAQLRL